MSEVSERMSVLVREEIELAKVEMTHKVSSIARGAAAVAAGAVFGVFAVIFLLLTIAWILDAILVNGAGDIWIGFAIVLAVLLIATIGSFLFALSEVQGRSPRPDDGDRRGQEDPGHGHHQGGAGLMPTRTPDEIRASIEQNRVQLGTSIEKLRMEVVRATDWRAQLRKAQPQVTIGAAAAGFVIGGGIAALGALTFGRRRRKRG